MFQARRPLNWLEIHLFFAAKEADGPLSLQNEAVLINVLRNRLWLNMYFVWVSGYCFIWKEVLREFWGWI